MTFANVYEMLNHPAEVRKTHFWDWFDGDDLKSWWFERHFTAGTVAMADEVDGGIKITSGATTSDVLTIDFNDIRHYAYDGSIVECVFKRSSVSSSHQVMAGTIAPGNYTSWHGYQAGQNGPVDTSNFSMRSNDGGVTDSRTSFSESIDTNYHRYKMKVNGTNFTTWFDGILAATKTNDLPSQKLQPTLLTNSHNQNSSAILQCTYIEAYNT